MGEDPALRRYRRFLVVLLLVGGMLAMALGGWLIWNGYLFYALLAALVLGFLMLLAHGYRQDAAEQAERYESAKKEP